MSILWLVIAIAMAFIEIITFNLVSIWFALGALITSILSIFISSVPVQVATFTVSSAIIFALVKPFAKRFVGFKPEKTNIDRVVGKIGTVTKNISKNELGEVKVDGKYWTAQSKETLNEGSKVEILSIEGVKLQVKKAKEDD